MPPTASPTQTRPTVSALAERLESVLEAYLGRYEQLLKHIAAQREALRRADGAGVAEATKAQQVTLEAIAMLEPTRGGLINDAAACLPGLNSNRSGPITLRDLARALPTANAGALHARAEVLRTRVMQSQEQMRVVGGATRSLLGHIEGLMRTVAQQISHAGTYSHRGVVEAGGTVVSSLDIRS